MTAKLLNCPFCGNSDFSEHSGKSIQVVKIERPEAIYAAQTVYFVRCHNCYAQAGCGVPGYNGLTGTTTTDDQARQIAIDKWNQRAPIPL